MKDRYRLLISIVISAGIHAAVLLSVQAYMLYYVNYGVQKRRPAPRVITFYMEQQQSSEPSDYGVLAQDIASYLTSEIPEEMQLYEDATTLSDSQIESLLEDTDRKISEMSYDQKTETLDKLLPNAGNIATTDLKTITRKIEEALDLDQTRAYAPVEGVSGEVDYDSLLLYDIRKIEQPGKICYRHILVDKGGRTLELDVPASEMTPEDMLSFNILRQSEQDENLKSMLHTVMKMVDKNRSKPAQE